MSDRSRLIITPPAVEGIFAGFSAAWPMIEKAMIKHMKVYGGNYEAFTPFLSSGLLFAMPLSLPTLVVNRLAANLTTAGCKVTVVPSEY